MKYYQDPINGKFYPADREEKQLQALLREQERAKAKEEKIILNLIWFINGFLIGWLLMFWGLRCF